MGYPDEARGLLKARSKTGYIQDAAVLAAYRKVRGNLFLPTAVF
jgi:hypothetical protein